MLSAIGDRAKTTAQERVQQHVGKMVRAFIMWVRSVGVCVSEREGERERVCVCVCVFNYEIDVVRVATADRELNKAVLRGVEQAIEAMVALGPAPGRRDPVDLDVLGQHRKEVGSNNLGFLCTFSLVRFGMLTRSKQQTKSSVCVCVRCWVLGVGGGGEGGHTNEGEPTGRVLTPATKPKGRERRLRSLTRAQPAWGNPHNGPIIRQMPTATQPLPTEHSRSTVSG